MNSRSPMKITLDPSVALVMLAQPFIHGALEVLAEQVSVVKGVTR